MKRRTNRSDGASRWRGAALAGLLFLGLAARVFGAWCHRRHLNPDAGVVALMAKHMAEGLPWPAFFYGQSYMGSLEPAVSAMLARLAGYSGFVVALGTALLGFLTLPVVYRWARDADSPAAGRAAVLFLVIGPGGFFHYHVSPRGGYALVMLLSALLLWLSGRLVTRERAAHVPAPEIAPWYGLLGLVAGLGWWTHPLMVAALISAGLLLLAGAGRRLGFRRAAWGLAGFLAGSLPFWAWNLTHQWASFALIGSLQPQSVVAGLRLFFVDRFLDLVELRGRPAAWLVAGVALYLGAVLAALGVLARPGAARRRRDAFVHTAAPLLFILVSAVLFAKSHFAHMDTPRYLLPIVPAMAVLIGLATARLGRALPRGCAGLAWLPVLALVAGQYRALPAAMHRARREESIQRTIEQVGDTLRRHDVACAFIDYLFYGWNAALNEAVCFCTVPFDRYPPYRRRAELAERVATLCNPGDILALLQDGGVTGCVVQTQDVFIVHDFQPPPPATLRPGAMASVRDQAGADVRRALTDLDLTTWWAHDLSDSQAAWLEVALRQPERVSRLRLVCWPEYPSGIQVEGRCGNGPWRLVVPLRRPSWYFWSETRPFTGTWQYRLDVPIPPAAGPLDGLRLRGVGPRVGVCELMVYAADPGTPRAGAPDWPLLLAQLDARGIDRLYCDRGVAAAVYRKRGADLALPLDPVAFGDIPGRMDLAVRLTPHTALLVRAEESDLARAALGRRRLALRDTPVGPWVLFDVESGRWDTGYAGESGLDWAGFGCLLARHKEWAAAAAARADACLAAGRADAALDLLQEADRVAPDYHPVLERLAACAAVRGEAASADRWRRRADRLARPDIPAAIRFPGGIGLEGISLSSRVIRPGDTLTIRYYWRLPAPRERAPRVFLHITAADPASAPGGAIGFQDDHALPAPAGAAVQPLPEVFLEERAVPVPPGLAPGRYELRLGLFQPDRKGRRLAPLTDLPCTSRAVRLPVTLEVAAAADRRPPGPVAE